MSKQRPVNLDLRTIKMPITAKASILHRISSVVLWVGMVFFLPAVFLSLQNEESYRATQTLVTETFMGQFICWGLLTAFGYYTAATLKHIIQDMGYCEELESGKWIAAATIITGIVLSVVWGIWIWG